VCAVRIGRQGRTWLSRSWQTRFTSPGPVHESLMVLERKGIVVFHPKPGLFSHPLRSRDSHSDIEVQVSTEEEMYYRFAEDRILGKLHGHVSEAELMARYGISRMRLMKILMRMSQEGWVNGGTDTDGISCRFSIPWRLWTRATVSAFSLNQRLCWNQLSGRSGRVRTTPKRT